ncbi:hypothetical protein [Salinithrix halophila]|uniref:SUKH superfamily protein n=1 Tax=Salinithrix halophila TaxID=1485204 RepID=A0ABV8JGC4_9BACL
MTFLTDKDSASESVGPLLANKKAFEYPCRYYDPEKTRFPWQCHGGDFFEPWYGGQFELYRISDILENQVPGLHPETWYPIGYQDGGYLLMDGEKLKEGHQDYLMWWESSLTEDVKTLGLNFELWLNRFIIAQGTKFWDWSQQNVHQYYRHR